MVLESKGETRICESGDSRTFECSICKRVCFSERGLRHHMKVKHLWSMKKCDTFQCEVCSKKFTTKGNLVRHVKQRHSSDALKCSTCQESFPSKIDLKLHTANMHPQFKSISFLCEICNRKFASKYNLNSHKSKVHSVSVTSSSTVECPTCQKSCYNRAGLNTHIHHKHPELLDEKVQCDLCSEKFVSASKLRTHKELMHSKSSAQFQCDVCKMTFVSKYGMIRHKINIHCGTVASSFAKKTFENFIFLSFKEFDDWKHDLEDKTKARFVKTNGQIIFKDYEAIHFGCYRNGTFKPKQNRQRRLKRQGSVKINGKCGAYIYAKFFYSGEIKVLFQSTHHSHDPELKHLNLRDREKSEIARMIQIGVPFSVIISLKRKYSDRYLKRQDLYNIARARCKGSIRDLGAPTQQGEESDHTRDKTIENEEIMIKNFNNALLNLSKASPDKKEDISKLMVNVTARMVKMTEVIQNHPTNGVVGSSSPGKANKKFKNNKDLIKFLMKRNCKSKNKE